MRRLVAAAMLVLFASWNAIDWGVLTGIECRGDRAEQALLRLPFGERKFVRFRSRTRTVRRGPPSPRLERAAFARNESGGR